MQPVVVSKEVANAFDYYRSMSVGISQEDQNKLFISLINSNPASGHGKVLKEYASENLTNFLFALLFGYTQSIQLEKEIAKMIKRWLDQPYEKGEVKRDIDKFAQEITLFFQQI